MTKTYSQQIHELADKIPTTILDITQQRVRGRIPTQAVSNFLTNREQGDWAERIVKDTVSDFLTDFDVVKYGKTDDIMAGDDNFADFYGQYQDELDKIGKRPDILIFEKGITKKDDISLESYDEHKKIVPLASLGWEIRSSSYLANKYKPSENAARQFLSFTVKVEDILIVLKWITTYNVPHYYVQVFFDSVYIISFKKILEIIANKENLKKIFFIERNTKNQMKTTLHIDINQGMKLGDIVKSPKHLSARKNLSAGRLLHYVTFENGTLEIDGKALNSVIEQIQSN